MGPLTQMEMWTESQMQSNPKRDAVRPPFREKHYPSSDPRTPPWLKELFIAESDMPDETWGDVLECLMKYENDLKAENLKKLYFGRMWNEQGFLFLLVCFLWSSKFFFGGRGGRGRLGDFD